MPSLSHRRLPPLNAVRAFEAAARRESLRAAADELGVTHGAVSRQLRLLEDWLGGPALFRRAGRGLALTAEGASLLAEVGPALGRISQASLRHRDGGRAAAVLRVNALATFSLRWLLPRLARFGREHPGIEVRLSTSSEPVDALAEEFDVVIRGGPDTFWGFTAEPLVSERRLPVCSPELAARLGLDSVGDLARHTLLHVSSLPRLWRDWLRQAGQPGLQPASSLVLDHFFLSIQAAIDGLGVAMGPTTLVEAELRCGRLVAPFPAISLPARSYFAYRPQREAADPAADTFCRWLAAVSAEPSG